MKSQKHTFSFFQPINPYHPTSIASNNCRQQLFCFLLLASSIFALAADITPHDLPEIGAKISIPENWKIETQDSEGVTTYQMSGKADYPCLTLIVTTDVPARTEMKPSEYAADQLSAATDLGAKIETRENGHFIEFSATYSVEGENEKQMNILDRTLAQDTLGTLYYLTWQDTTIETTKGLCEAILASFKPDPKYAKKLEPTEDDDTAEKKP